MRAMTIKKPAESRFMAVSRKKGILPKNFSSAARYLHDMIRHECGYEMEILCKRCGTPLQYNPRLGLHCPACGREVTILCHKCGKKW